VHAEEPLLHLPVALPDLAEHPPHRLVNEVVIVAHQPLGHAKSERVLAALDPAERRDHRDPPLPHALRRR
jgi:hypothetical protein